MKKKGLTLLVATTMLACSAIGGTLAWLTDTTEEVKNTFTTSGIDITLTETKQSDGSDRGESDWSAKMVPGYVYSKNPVVTVKANSEDCYLFVKFDETNVTTTNDGTTFNYFVYESNLTTGNGWTKLTGVTGVDNVWYREVTSSTSEQEWSLLKDNTIKVNENLTSNLMPTSEDDIELVYTAYASQLHKNADEDFTAAEAWANVYEATSADGE